MEILCIGEILIDLTQTGVDEAGVPQFAANPGGAPANLAVAAARLGGHAAFAGRAGEDAFGRYLRRTLQENGVDTSALRLDPDHTTTLAVVSVDGRVVRAFSFYRRQCADVMLTEADLPRPLLEQAKLVHFGSVSLTEPPARDATLAAVRLAKHLGKTVTYDPNYRHRLWKSKEQAVQHMREPLDWVDVLKVSEEELPLLSGVSGLEQGAAALAGRGIPLVLVTLGERGAYYRFGGRTGQLPGVPCTVGDTNGAGDTFFGAVLAKLAPLGLANLTEAALREILAFANQAASLTASRRGAIPAMPTLDQVERALAVR